MVTVILVAAGSGSRMNTKVKKQFMELNSKPIICYSMETFQSLLEIDEIIVVTGEESLETVKDIIKKYKISKAQKVVKGGKERQDSVYNGLLELSEDTDIVLIHDGVRPFIKKEDIIKTVKYVKSGFGAILGVKTKNTIKSVDENGFVKQTLKRNELFDIQTPQVFWKNDIIKAHNEAIKDKFLGTDDSSLAERIGVKVKIIEGSYSNIKITTKEDILTAKLILEENDENS